MKALRVLAASIAGILLIGVIGTGGETLALWNARSTVAAGTVTAGTISATQTVTGVTVTFNGSTTTATGAVTIANTGNVPATWSTSVALRSGTSASLAQAITVVLWKTASASQCTTSATPASPVSGTWSVPPKLSGTVAEHASVVYCVRSTLGTVTGIPSNSQVLPTLHARLQVGGWTATAATDATQTFQDTSAPTAPGTPVASSTTSTSTTLTWTASTDNVGVASYEVLRNGSVIANVAGTTHTVSGLTSGTSYTFAVRARDAANNISPVSGSVTVSTTKQLQCTNEGDTAVRLTWNADGRPTGTWYEVLLNGIVRHTVQTTSSNLTSTDVAQHATGTFPATVRLPGGSTLYGTNVTVSTTPNGKIVRCAT